MTPRQPSGVGHLLSDVPAGWGVDLMQWRVLTRTMIKLDLRVGGFGGRAFGDESNATLQAALRVMMYLAMGVGFSLVAGLMTDVFLSGVIVLTGVMFMLGSMLLIDYQSVITSPDDYHILGYQPISSRTYFAVRLTNVLIYAGIPTTAFALPVALGYGLSGGRVDLALGAAGLLAVYGMGLMTTLAIVVLYAGILRVMSPERLERALSYLQLVMGFAVYGGYFGATTLINRDTFQELTLDHAGWVLVHPASWFASYLELASGRAGVWELGPAVFSVVFVLVLVRTAGGRLSLEYSEQFGALLSAGAARTGSARRTTGRTSPLARWWLGTGEARTVGLLARAQFRHDQKFRLAVLGVLPMTALYLLMSLRQGGVGDPFVAEPRAAGDANSPLLLIAVTLFPVMLKAALAHSDAYRASWIFYASPADHARIVLGLKRYVLRAFVAPYLALIAVAFAYLFGHVGHAVAHVVTLGLLSHLFLQLAVLADPDLPFSKPMKKGERSSAMIALMIALSFAAVAGMFVIRRWVYPSVAVTIGMMAAIVALSAGIDRLIGVRVRRLSARWEYVE